MDEKAFNVQINGTRNFHLRRAVERIREGLFHPLGVQWLTSGEEKLNQLFDRGAMVFPNGETSLATLLRLLVNLLDLEQQKAPC